RKEEDEFDCARHLLDDGLHLLQDRPHVDHQHVGIFAQQRSQPGASAADAHRGNIGSRHGVDHAGREQGEKVDPKAVPIDLAQTRDLGANAGADDVIGQRVAELDAQRLRDALLQRDALAFTRLPPLAGDDAVAARRRIGPRKVEFALAEAPGAFLGQPRRVERLVVDRYQRAAQRWRSNRRSAIMDHAITAAVISIAAMPPTMIAPVLTSCACQPISSATVAAPRIYANDPPARGMPISRRRTRSGGTFDSANKGGKAKPRSISNPVAIAATAGARPGGGRSALAVAPASITRHCWPPSAPTPPQTLAASP